MSLRGNLIRWIVGLEQNDRFKKSLTNVDNKGKGGCS